MSPNLRACAHVGCGLHPVTVTHDVRVGAPIDVQSMTNTDTADIEGTALALARCTSSKTLEAIG